MSEAKTIRIIPPALRRAAIAFCRNVPARQAIARRREWPQIEAPVSLHVVLSRDTMLMSMLMLRSLEHHSRLTWVPILHEDGSLDDDDAKAFLAHFPDARMVRRTESDAVLGEALQDYPACRENRMKHNFFLKVFDARHYAPHDHYIVIDSDIVFFRRPDFVLRWIEERPETFWFMQDTKEKYATARADLEEAFGVPIWQRVNSGFDLMFRPGVDLQLAETFLERCVPMVREYQFLEQTFFAITGSAWKHGGLLPPEYEISWTNFRRPGAVCRHYVGPFKNDALFIEGATTFWWQSLFSSNPRAPQPS